MTNITEYTFVVAAIELLGAMICLISIVVEVLQKKNRDSEGKALLGVLVCSMVCLASDGVSYLLDGNAGGSRLIINATILFVDYASFMMTMVFIYRFLLLQLPRKSKLTKILSVSVYFILGVNFVILLTNPVTHFLYKLSLDNVYSVGSGFIVYVLILFYVGVVVFFHAIECRRELERPTLLAMMLFLVLMIAGGMSEIFLNDFPGSNLTLGVGIMVYFLVHKINQSRRGDIRPENRHIILVMYLFIVMTICVFGAFIINLANLTKMTKENSENRNTVEARMVYESIENLFIKPITVSETMAQSSIIKDAFKHDVKLPINQANKELVGYLSSLRNGLDYQTAFAIPSSTKKYYTSNGIKKIVNVDGNEHDVWYKNFWTKDKIYDIDVDNDEDASGNLSIFVNMKVKDEYGNSIGVCGVAMDIAPLQMLFKEYEDKYNLEIALINGDGLVQVSSDTESIENKYYDSSYLKKMQFNEYFYQRFEDSTKTTMYMDSLDWYVVVIDKEPEKINLMRVIGPGLVASCIGFLLMIFSYAGVRLYYKKIEVVLEESHKTEQILKNKSEHDELTGVYNRLAYEEHQKDINLADRIDFAVVILDINGLKTVNDRIGHIAGDELIKGAAECIGEAFNEKGAIYRIGGDEFAVILYANKTEVERLIAEFQKKTDNWYGDIIKELSVSLGYAGKWEYPDANFVSLVKIADERMYADKNEYYRRTGKDRRMSW